MTPKRGTATRTTPLLRPAVTAAPARSKYTAPVTTSLVLLLTLALLALFSPARVEAGRFKCPPPPPPPPPIDDIALLHPAHVGITMAMGDSITAAFAAHSLPLEARGISWSIGEGSDDQLTLPRLLKYYSPGVAGASTGNVIPKNVEHLPSGDFHPATDHLNVAESMGAVHLGSMQEQWAFLLQQSKAYANFNTSWKVLTVWMTANDVCGQCGGPMDLKDWSATYEQLLSNVSTHWNRTYVNLMSTLDLSNVARLQKTNDWCKLEHEHLFKECGCIDRGTPAQLAQLDENIHAVNSRLHNISAEWYAKLRATGREKDMAVVTQGFLEGVGARVGFSFLNIMDCFHPSAAAHEDLAVSLWNSMLCTGEANRKARCGSDFAKAAATSPACPDASAVFYTGPDVVPSPLPP